MIESIGAFSAGLSGCSRNHTIHKSKNYYIIIILVLASILRFWGIWHGYPFSYYPDEQHFINRAVSFGSGDFNPHWFHKPAFLMYLLFSEYGIFYIVGKVFGYFPNAEAFAVYYFKNPWPFILIGRMTVTLFGIATVYVTYGIGEKFWSKKVGLYASLFLGLCYGHIFSGQDIKADVPTTLFTILAVFYLIRIVENGFQAGDYVRSGLFAGLGTATKYYSIALLPCILLASVYEMYRRKKLLVFRKYIYALISFWGIYFMGSPYNFLDPLGRRATFGQILKIFNMISPCKLNLYAPFRGKEEVLASRYENHYLLKSLYHYIHVLFSQEGAGIVIAVIFALGFIYILMKPRMKTILLLSFPVIFSMISIVMSPSYTAPRHQLIIYPFLSIAGALAVCQLYKKFDHRWPLDLFLAVILLFPLYHALRNDIFVSRHDTRTIAKYWIETNIPSGAKIVLDANGPKLRRNPENLEDLYNNAIHAQVGQFTTHMPQYYRYLIQASQGEITYDMDVIRFPWWRRGDPVIGKHVLDSAYDRDMANPLKKVGVEPLGTYSAQGYRYVITDNDRYAEFFEKNSARARNFPAFAAFYNDLFDKGCLIKEFDPEFLGLPGPVIKIFRIDRLGKCS